MAKEGPTLDDLLAALAQRQFSPVYLFYGEEDFLIEEATDAVIEAALTTQERGFNLDKMYGAEADPRDVISHASSFPMMSERRVVVVREVEKLAQPELLADYIENPLASTCLVLTSSKPDFRRKPFVTAKKHAFVLECKPLWDNQIPSWVARRVKKSGREISPEAASLLPAYLGSSLRDIVNALEKVYLYTGDRKMISADDVTAVVGVSREFGVFELQWAIGMKETQKATDILHHMLEQGEQPVLIVAVLTRFFQTLWKLLDVRRRGVQGNQQYAQAGIFSYAEKYSQAAGRFTMEEIEDAFIALAELDEQLKTSAGGPHLLLQAFIVRATTRRPASFVSSFL